MILAKFSGRERLMTIVTAAIIISAFSYVFIVEPLMSAYGRLNRRIDVGIVKLQKGHKLLRDRDAIISEYERYAAYIKPVSSDEEEITSMLKVIEATARANNVDIGNIRPQPVKDTPFYKDFTFDLTAEADIDQLVKFIYDLQTSGNLLRVRRLTVSSSSSGSKGLRAMMEIGKPAIKTL